MKKRLASLAATALIELYFCPIARRMVPRAQMRGPIPAKPSFSIHLN